MKLIKTYLLSLFIIVFLSCTADQDLASLVLEEIAQEENDEGSDSTNDDSDDDSTDDVKDDPVSTTLKAFPSAYGAGAYASGGRGGKVLNVTTTEDTGREGSLRWAMSQQYPRIIVFKVGGEFELTQGRLKLISLNNDLTIAGQTAPGDGVTLVGDYLSMQGADNIVIRYIRFRGLKNSGVNGDLLTATDCTNVIMDHCSGSWGRDEIWSFTSMRSGGYTGNITIQRSLLAEMDPSHSTGSIMGAYPPVEKTNAGEFSWNSNYVYNISHRFPNVLGDGKFEIKNNVIYNWSYRLTSAYYGAEVNQQNNYYKVGPKTLRNSVSNENGDLLGTLNRVGNEGTTPKIYGKGNLVLPNVITDPNADNIVMWRWFLSTEGKSRYAPVSSALKLDNQPSPLGGELPLLSAEDAYGDILNDVGANKSLKADGTYKNNTDELDKSYIDAAINDKGTASYRQPSEWILPPHTNSNNSNPYKDTDMDGMPDVWEIAKGLNPEVDDSAGDIDDDGYTNIEEFINSVDF